MANIRGVISVPFRGKEVVVRPSMALVFDIESRVRAVPFLQQVITQSYDLNEVAFVVWKLLSVELPELTLEEVKDEIFDEGHTELLGPVFEYLNIATGGYKLATAPENGTDPQAASREEG